MMQVGAGMANSVLVGQLIDSFLGRVEGAIQQAAGRVDQGIVQADMALIHAGVELRQVVERVRGVFRESLDVSVERTEGVVREALRNLEGVFARFQEGNVEQIRRITGEFQRIVNTVPGADRHPQLTNVTPKYVDPRQEGIHFVFSGNFFTAAIRGHEPKLVFNGQNFRPIMTQTTSLGFRIPFNAIFQGEGIRDGRISYGEGALHIPYDSGVRGVVEAVFRVTIGAMPSFVASVDVVYNEMVESIDFEVRTQRFDQDSRDFENKLRNYQIVPRPGYKILGGKVALMDRHNLWSIYGDSSGWVEAVRHNSNRLGKIVGSPDIEDWLSSRIIQGTEEGCAFQVETMAEEMTVNGARQCLDAQAGFIAAALTRPTTADEVARLQEALAGLAGAFQIRAPQAPLLGPAVVAEAVQDDQEQRARLTGLQAQIGPSIRALEDAWFGNLFVGLPETSTTRRYGTISVAALYCEQSRDLVPEERREWRLVRWNERHVVPLVPDARNVRVNVETFDGGRYEFINSGVCPYLRVDIERQGVTLTPIICQPDV